MNAADSWHKLTDFANRSRQAVPFRGCQRAMPEINAFHFGFPKSGLLTSMPRFLLLCCLSLWPLAASLVDRIAIVVDGRVITESQVDEEIRVTAFLNRQKTQFTREERRAAADRLIQQALIQREMRLGRYPSPTDEEVGRYYDGLAETLGGKKPLAAALESAGLTTEVVKAHMALQLTSLRFIEYRFRPNFEISEPEIAAFQARQSVPSPHDAVRQTLIEQRTDEILSAWLEETRKQVDIEYLDSTLQ